MVRCDVGVVDDGAMFTMRTIAHGVETRVRSSRPVEFVCPRCGVDRDGALIVPQRWYCVRGLPLMPLAILPPTVECAVCGHRASPSVLDVLTSTQLSRCLERATASAIAHVVRAGGDPSRIDLEVVAEAIELMQSEGFLYDEVTLAGDVLDVDPAGLRATLTPLADELTPHGKQSFLHRMVSVALADGELTRAEQAALVDIGAALGMAAPHINGVLAAAANHHAPA